MEKQVLAENLKQLTDQILAYQKAIHDADEALSSAEQALNLLLKEGGFVK